MTLYDSHGRELPRPRPMPLAMPPPAPLRCRKCGEEDFPNGRLRACRCDRRARAWLIAVLVVYVVVLSLGIVMTVRGAP